jgi:hypothetical protein
MSTVKPQWHWSQRDKLWHYAPTQRGTACGSSAWGLLGLGFDEPTDRDARCGTCDLAARKAVSR